MSQTPREERLAQVLQEAESLLDRYREKAKHLVQQTGGRYEGGEAIQFLVTDYDKHKIVAAEALRESAPPTAATSESPKGYK